MCIHMCGVQRSPSGVFFYCSLTLCLRQGFSLVLRLEIAGWIDDWPVGSRVILVFACPWLGSQAHDTLSGFDTGPEKLNSAPHIWTTSSLRTEPSSKSWRLFPKREKFSGSRLVLLQLFLLFTGTLHDTGLTHIVSSYYVTETQSVPWADSEHPYVVAKGTEMDWSDCVKLHASFKCNHPRWKQNFSLFSMSLLEGNPLGRRFHPF